MSSISLIWKYLIGMKRKLLMTFLSIIALFLIIQGVFIFAFDIQQKELQSVINSDSGDLRVSLYNSDASYDARLDLVNNIEAYRSSLDQNKIGWDESYALTIDLVQDTELDTYFVEDSLFSSIGININGTNKAFVTESAANLLNLTESEAYEVYNFSFSVSILDNEQTEKIYRFLSGHDSLVPENIIMLSFDVLRNSSFYKYDALQFYYELQYNRSLLESARISTIENTLEQFSLEIKSQLDLFLVFDVDVRIESFTLNDIDKIQERTAINMLIFFLFSCPLLLAGIFFYGTTLKSTKQKWQQELYILWHRGFSRKKSFKLLLGIFSLFDSLILVGVFTLLLIESLVLGMIIDLSFWILFCFHILLVVLAFILQIREIYRICFPDIEKISLISAEKSDFKRVVDFIIKKPKTRKKYLIIAGIILVIGILLLNCEQILFWLQTEFDLNSSSLLFISSGRQREYIGFLFTLSGLIITLISLIIVVIIMLPRLFQVGNILLLGKRKNKETLRVFQKIFKRGIYQNKKMGIMIFILFFGVSFTWIFASSTIIEEQNDYGSISTPDIVLRVDRANHLPDFKEKIQALLTRTEIEASTSIYQADGFMVANDQAIYIDFNIINPITLPPFLEEGLDVNIFEFQSTKNIFQRMQEEPSSCAIDIRTFAKYGFEREEETILAIFIAGKRYIRNASIIDAARFDATNPRGTLKQHVLIPMQMIGANLNLTDAKYIYMNFKDINQINSFQDLMINVYNIPQEAIVLSIQVNESNLEKFLLFLESISALVILLISIPVFLELFYTNLQTIAKLYSRGFNYRKSMKNVFAQYFIFWFTFSFLGSLTAFSLLGILKWFLPKILFGQYYPIHFEISSIIVLLSSLVAALLIPILLLFIAIKLPSYRTRMVSTLILTNEEKQIG